MTFKYIIDTNIFVDAHNRYYPMSCFPGFWEFLTYHFNQGTFVSSNFSFKEMKDYGDDLSKWIKMNKNFFIADDSPDVQMNFGKVSRYVSSHPIWESSNKANFLKAGVADGFVIAHAMSYDATVVSNEKLETDIKCKKVKIPNVCQHFNIRCINSDQFIKELQPVFHWKSDLL